MATLLDFYRNFTVERRMAALLPKYGMTLAEAVTASSVDRDSILSAIETGDLAARKCGSGRFVILSSDLAAWLESLPWTNAEAEAHHQAYQAWAAMDFQGEPPALPVVLTTTGKAPSRG